SKITKILTDAVPLEKEHEILMDHEYDGIMELDNNLPPWWLYSFYVSIVFAFVYIINYHVIESSPLQQEEYELAMAEGEKEVAEYLASQKLNVDETNVVLLTDASDISKGKGIFEKKCVACHGKQGEGVIGPNLTDKYWLHGGDIASVFKIVKYGKAEKGMQAWKDELNPIEMQQVSSYIKSIAGTAVGMGKAPQGEIYEEGTNEQTPSDSTSMEAEQPVEVALK
ncbi:MAG: cbb3-type cytochrome c oxidase N-terminal domain-containing protein, partial [Flavobacteriales bacterium]